MDSLTQFVLGASIGVAVIGKRAPPWQAALWAGVSATLPDLDVLIEHGDPIRNMTLHRAESHSLFFLTLASPLIAWMIGRIHARPGFTRWWLAVWLALVTHPLLDWLTVYGTQLGLPFTDYPFAVGSIFVIDPVYTLIVTGGVVTALVMAGDQSKAGGLRWNRVALALSTIYLGWSVLAQHLVSNVATASLRAQNIPTQHLLVTPAAFNTLLWRVLAIEGDHYAEGFYSFLDCDARITFNHYPRGENLYRQSMDNWYVGRIAWFSHGFFAMHENNGRAVISDLRMGQEPSYVFSFTIPQTPAAKPERLAQQLDLRAGLGWLWSRMWGGRLRCPPKAAGPDAPS